MLIESCKIENMGKLSNVSLNFNDGLNVIKEDNGWGKSTLAAFIRAMFYGFEGERARNGIQSERKKYMPWQGGVYGGRLVFSTKGKRYEIIRNFGNKSSEDFFELRNADTGLISDDFSEKIGEELFHINSESFMRTIFISQNDCSSSDTTDDINSRIGRIDDSMDLNRFNKADDILTKAINSLSEKRNGKQNRLSNDITEVRKKINAGNEVEENLNKIQQRIGERNEKITLINKQITELTHKKDEIFSRNLLRNELEIYEDLLKEKEQKQQKVSEKRELFPGDIPTEETIDEWMQLLSEIHSLELTLDETELTEYEIGFLSEYSVLFIDNEPSEDELNSYLEKINKLRYYKRQVESLSLSDKDRELLDFYRDMFGLEEKPTQKIRDLIESNSKRRSAQEKIKYLKEEEERIEADILLKKKTRITVSVLFLVVGLGLLVLHILLRNNLLFIPTAVCIFLSLLFGINKKSILKLENLHRAKESELAETEGLSDSLEKDILGFLDNHGIVVETEDIDDCLQELLSYAYTYTNLLDREQQYNNYEKLSEIVDLETDITNYLSGYGLTVTDNNYDVLFTKLKSNLSHYKECIFKKQRYDNRKKEIQEKKILLKKGLSDYGFEMSESPDSLLKEIENNISEYSEASSLVSDVLQRIFRFEAEHNIEELRKTELGEEELDSEQINLLVEQLDAEKDDLNKQNISDKDNLDAERERYEQWLDDKQQLDRLNEELACTKNRYDILVKTRDLLIKAKTGMTSEYIEPLTNGFGKYYSLLTGDDAKDYSLDANIELTRYEKGARRDKELLSLGYQDLVGFCMRLSMADAMYKNENPLLIMDDPFVNLDDKKLAGAKLLMTRIAESYQIIYMTCREDRL